MTNSAPGAIQPTIAFAYDPLMRLASIDSTNGTFDVAFGYDGQEVVYEALSGGRTRRYVHGPGTDEPLVGYLVTPGAATSRLWYQADERGSITRHSNDAGVPASTIGKYDEYGAGGIGRFRYTGQYWLGEANLLYYRARIYDARLGRFLQPDPIGYGDGLNMYAYVGGDPVNFVDPTGTCMLLTYSMHYYSSGGDDLGEVPDSRWTERSADCFPLGGGAGGIFHAGGKGGVIDGGGGTGMGGPKKPLQGPEPALRPSTKKYLCNKLSANDFNVPRAYRSVLSDRRTTVNGKNQWDVPEFREAENWIYATGQWRSPPTDGSTRLGTYFHQYWKIIGGGSDFSQDALNAGLNGINHTNITKQQLMGYCGV